MIVETDFARGLRARAPRLARRMAATALLALLALAPRARAQFGAGGGATDIPEPKELVKIAVAPVHVPAGGSARVAVQLQIATGWHINANPAANENSIATEVAVAPATGLAAAPPAYPEPKVEKLSFDPEPLLVFDGATTIPVTVKAVATATTGARTLKGTIRFQACNDQVCLPPASLAFDVPVIVDAAPAGARSDTTVAALPADTSHARAAPPPPGFATAPPAGYTGATGTTPANATSARLGGTYSSACPAVMSSTDRM